MIFDNYEISLWTHNDQFITILGANGAYYLSEAYEPIYNYKTDGEETLKFTIPVYYIIREADALLGFNITTDENILEQYDDDVAVNCYLSNGQLITVSPHIIINDQGYAVIDNSRWYSILTNNSLLANEKKIKLIFDKGTATERIKEFVITNLTQKRDGDNIYCEVECGGLAFYELGKIGYNLTFNDDVILLEEKETSSIIYPTLDYWMDKVFPAVETDSRNNWLYSIEMDYTKIFNGAAADKVYEEPGIISWSGDGVNEEFTPTYRTELVEKCRYPHIEKSNKYNICQDLAELYGVYVRVEYEHTDIDNPYRITARKIIFYNTPYSNTEYSITYGDNEMSISKISDSKDLVTKLYVEDVESEYSNSGLISISESSSNRSKENFILNFDYYEQAGMLNESQRDAIHGDRDRGIIAFEEALRMKNLALEAQFRLKYSYENDKLDLEVKIQNAEDRAEAALDLANDCMDKLSALDAAITDHSLVDSRVAYLVLGVSPNQYINFRRNGIESSGFTVAKSDKTVLTLTTHYTKILNSYGNITGINILPAAGMTSGQFLYCTYTYDLFTYYTNQQTTYMDVYNTNTLLITEELQSALDAVIIAITACDNTIDTLLDDKSTLIIEFNNMLGYFLREGSWNSSDYRGPYQQFDLSTVAFDDGSTNFGCKLYYDDIARNGEALTWYLVGATTTYYKYVEFGSTIPYANIDNLELTEKVIATGVVVKKYINGAHFQPQYCKFISGSPLIRAVLVFDKNINVGVGNGLYYNTTLLTVNTFTSAHAIVFRRIQSPDTKLLLNSLELSIGTIELQEFEDYFLFVDSSANTIVGLKFNNNVPGNLTTIHVRYKSDRTVEQLYWDALEVSKRSAFPDAKYEVEFIYLQKALNHVAVNTAISAYQSISANLNNTIELSLASVVRINDYELELRGVKGVVSEITLHLEQPDQNSFIVQNYKTRFQDIFERIVASTEQMSSRGMAYERAATALTPIGDIVGDVLQNAINNNNLIFSSGIKSNVSWNENGLFVENAIPYVNGVKGQVLVKGGGIFLSNRLDDDGLNRIYTSAITPTGINAAVITAGRLDTEKVNIYSGSQLRFMWNADGLFAYQEKANGGADFNNYVKYNHDGLFLTSIVEGYTVNRAEVSWNGFILRSNSADGTIITDVFTADNLGNLSITGIITATGGIINGDVTVSGSLGTPEFASGALGIGWKVDGTGDATFNNVFVRGEIAASVFTYEQISSVGGQVYIAPTLIFLVNSNAITKPSTKYIITIPQNFGDPTIGGRTWTTSDIISLNGFVTINDVIYELRDIHCIIDTLNSTNIILTTVNDASTLSCYDSTGVEQDYVTIPWTGGIVSYSAKGVYLGTKNGSNELLRKGILLTTVGSYTPFIDVYDDTVVAGMPKVRLGELSGITNTNYFGPSPLSGYGLYSENVYLIGAINAQSGSIGVATNKWIIGSDATNASIYNGKSAYNANDAGIYLGTDAISLGANTTFWVKADGTFSFGQGAIDFNGSLLDIDVNNMNVVTGGTLTLAVGSDFSLLAGIGTFTNKYLALSNKLVDTYYLFAGATASNGTGAKFLLNKDGSFNLGTSISYTAAGVLDITADSINIASGGTISLSAASQITIGTKPMDVGGTNLIRGSVHTSDIVVLYGVSTSGGFDVQENVLPSGEGAVYPNLTRTAGDYVWFIDLKAISPSFGTDTTTVYTLSFTMQSNNTQTIAILPANCNVLYTESLTCALPWKRFVYHIQPTQLRNSVSHYNTHITMTGSGLGHFSVSSIKLEKGNVATAWSPAPEDTTNAIADAVSGRTTIWYQAAEPTATETGDLWYDTDASPVIIKRWSGAAWVDITTVALSQALSAASTAQSTADGKIITFSQDAEPTAEATGDLWIDTNDNNKLYRWSGTAWTLYKVASGYVATSYITIDNDSIDIASGGDIDVQSGGKLNIKSGGDIEVEGGADINVASTGKINVASGGEMNISSGGTLNLSSASQITIGTNPLSVGGTNLFKNEWLVAPASGTTQSFSLASWATDISIGGMQNYFVAGETYTIKYTVKNNSARPASDFDVQAVGALMLNNHTNYAPIAGAPVTEMAQYETRVVTATITWPTVTGTNYFAFYTQRFNDGTVCNFTVTDFKIEKGFVATDWCESEGELHNSSITIDSDGIEILSGGDLIMSADGVLKITGGMSADATAISIRNDTDYFISAGDKDSQADCPFYVKKNGSIKASAGKVGGFTIGPTSMSAVVEGVPFVLDAAYPGIAIGNVVIISTAAGFSMINTAEAEDGYTASILNDNSSMFITARNSWISMGIASLPYLVRISRDLGVEGNLDAATYTDFTPSFDGDALTALSAVKTDAKRGIDHATLPEAARKMVRRPPPLDSVPKDARGNPDWSKAPLPTEEPGRDIGMMISILTKAVQELMAVNEKQNARIATLEKEVAALKLGSRL